MSVPLMAMTVTLREGDLRRMNERQGLRGLRERPSCCGSVLKAEDDDDAEDELFGLLLLLVLG